MTLVFLMVNYLILSAVSLVAITICVAILWEFWQSRNSRIEAMIRELARKQSGSDLRALSWWFSEHEPTEKLLRHIGQDMQDNGIVVGIDKIRNQWRKDMETKSAEQTIG